MSGCARSTRCASRHAPEKGAIVSFEMKGAHAHDVSTIIDRSGVAVRAGTHCASRC
jgi:cysteine desulfurase / selenocysteine lyase